MSDVTLTREEYLALLALARRGMSTPDEARTLEVFLRNIDKRNSLNRWALLVQWQDADQPLPPGTRFPENWPPQLRRVIERDDRPVAKTDVLKLVQSLTATPLTILVTRDLGGLVGWTKIEDYFVT